jgi:integrase
MRRAQPYFKKSHDAWYVNFHGKPHRLAADEEAAWTEYHRLMAGDEPVTPNTTVAAVLEQFLAWTKSNRAPRTLEWYTDHLASFAKHLGARLKLRDLKPYHATRWIEKRYATSGAAHRRGAAVAVSRAFNWAKKQGMIAANPVSGMERPPPVAREAYLPPENWARLAAHLEGDPLGDLFQFMRETGCRPWEVRHAEARHWDRKGEKLVLELALTKGKEGKKLPRIIRLNERATAIVQRLALKNPDGRLFRNARGKPWSDDLLEKRCHRLRKKLGFAFFPYILRHTFCTDALLRGVDPITVAHLMGHKDASMVMKVYSHLIHQSDHLKEKLRQATG